MAYTRTKKLTDSTYAPTNPVSEAAARKVVDDAIDELNLAYGSGDGADYIGEIHGGSVQDRIDYIETELADITQGSVADDSITTAKLADDAVTTDKILDEAVTSAKIAADTITDDNMAATMKKGVAGGVAAYDDQKYVKLLEYTNTSNVTQVNLNVSGIDFTLYADIWLFVRDIYAVTTGTKWVGMRLNNVSDSAYDSTHVFYGTEPGVSVNQASFFATGLTIGYTTTVPAQINARIHLHDVGYGLYAEQIGYQTAENSAGVLFGFLPTASPTALTSINILSYTSGQLKAGAKFYVYGVLK